MRVVGVMLTAAVVGLAGCGGEDKAEAPAAGASGGDAAATVAAPAGGGGEEVTSVAAATSMVPKMKPGQWRLVSRTNDQTMPEITQCVTAESPTWDANQAGGTCADFRARKQGDAVVMTANCEAPGGGMSMETRLTGDFQTRYTIDTTIRQPGNPAAPLTRISMTGTYVGPTC